MTLNQQTQQQTQTKTKLFELLASGAALGDDVERPFHRLGRALELREPHFPALVQREQPGHRVLELAHVPGPAVAEQSASYLAANSASSMAAWACRATSRPAFSTSARWSASSIEAAAAANLIAALEGRAPPDAVNEPAPPRSG